MRYSADGKFILDGDRHIPVDPGNRAFKDITAAGTVIDAALPPVAPPAVEPAEVRLADLEKFVATLPGAPKAIKDRAK